MPKTIKTRPFDSAVYLDTPEAIEAYLEDAFESGDTAVIADALGVVARARGMERVAQSTEPRAATVTYDRDTGRIVIELINDTIVQIPARLLQGLQGADPCAIADVRIDAGGYGIHWPVLDVDLAVPALLAGVFGTKSYMARIAGKAKSQQAIFDLGDDDWNAFLASLEAPPNPSAALVDLMTQPASQDLNSGHLLEALDRAHTIQVMLDELLGDHPIIEGHSDLKAAYDRASEAIMDLYQAIGRTEPA